MIEKILNIKNSIQFDFRDFACPDDELFYLFDEWVDHYRLKYAICKAINPRSILEIGVRYGYSAIAFLHACKDATYLGIDNNSDAYGGVVGAVEWAKKVTEKYHAEYLIADTQQMTSLPGGPYDFIHIDGQQDGDGTFHDLEIAMKRGSWILVDGYLWTQENMLSSTYFMKKYRCFIDYALVIQGYAGDLLLNIKSDLAGSIGEGRESYRSLMARYDENYFLTDCGGYDTFKRSRGMQLDERLCTIFALVNPRPGEKILDVGCGRGELSHALSGSGASVVGIDYSESAVTIARKSFSGNTTGKLHYICDDFLRHDFTGQFDKVIAADFIEHIDQAYLDQVLKKISLIVGKKGVVIMHTLPNKLNITYNYRNNRNMIRKLGGYIPKNPRTFYEDLLHLHEQSPASLNRSLKRHFKHVKTWLPWPDTAGSLQRPLKKSEIMGVKSIFAMASNRKITNEDILCTITQNKLSIDELHIGIKPYMEHCLWQKSSRVCLRIKVHNKSVQRLSSFPPFPVHISYHWQDENKEIHMYEGLRKNLAPPLLPFEMRDMSINILTPDKVGNYYLLVTLVQENNLWLEEVVEDLPVVVSVSVQ
jgi:2-polyprenyl-3-methyl-5-hydroxy-6-metoxy-1,4-benzoquinol methylase